MAYQNFFATANNYRRKSPAQASGKELNSEFRMRNEGSSVQIVSVRGYETDEKGKIAVLVQSLYLYIVQTEISPLKIRSFVTSEKGMII